MSVDTVKLRSPALTEETVKAIESACCALRIGWDMAANELLYEITTGQLAGSFDHRVSVRPLRKEKVVDLRGVPHWEDCPPYIEVEGSVHKALVGHNVLGGPEDFQAACAEFIAGLSALLGVDLPPAGDWFVRRVDWAECFVLGEEAVQPYFDGLRKVTFPRRKASWPSPHSVRFSGDSTTVKAYWKGDEFRQHDGRRLMRWQPPCDEQSMEWPEYREAYAKQCTAWREEVRRLQAEANKRIRFEVEIHSAKLDRDFGFRPRVRDVSGDYLIGLYEAEMLKLVKVGDSGMKVVRDVHSVEARLRSVYPTRQANNLIGHWHRLSAMGEDHLKQSLSRAQLYRVKRQLSEAGVSWLGGDIVKGAVVLALPQDFKPLRSDPRRCQVSASEVLRRAA